MTRFRRCLIVTSFVLVWASTSASRPSALATGVPEKLSDQEFWRLSSEFSEPNGYFQSDNLVSNERLFQQVVPTLLRQRGRGAYLGVAPDQNFTFIVALDPRIAFIVDIRRGNLHEQLMYKALFELSSDRASFCSRLFARKRPDGLGTLSTVRDLLGAFANVPASDALYRENLKLIQEHLTRTHGFPLTEEDLKGIDYVYGMFVKFGPDITYQSSNGVAPPAATPSRAFFSRNMPTYADLQTATDMDGQNRGYLASEENFRMLKNFETRNLLVPVVGDFAGPRALRSVGQYLAEHGTTITAFYVSNVEQYLFQNGVWQNFYRNVMTMPLDDGSVFIRSIGGSELLDPIRPLLRDVAEGKVQTYLDLRGRGSR
jgi:hypothetical protein